MYSPDDAKIDRCIAQIDWRSQEIVNLAALLCRPAHGAPPPQAPPPPGKR